VITLARREVPLPIAYDIGYLKILRCNTNIGIALILAGTNLGHFITCSSLKNDGLFHFLFKKGKIDKRRGLLYFFQ